MKFLVALNILAVLNSNAFANSPGGWSPAQSDQVMQSREAAAFLRNSIKNSQCEYKNELLQYVSQTVAGKHSQVMVKVIRSPLASTMETATEKRFQVTLENGVVFYYTKPAADKAQVTVSIIDKNGIESDRVCRFPLRG